MNIALCDDNEELLETLKKILMDFAAKYNDKFIIDCYTCAVELINVMENKERYDIIFLDIQMPQMNGVETGKYIREVMNDNVTQIVYISGESKYAMDLFDVRPMNFIIKPFQKKQIEEVMLLGIKLINYNKRVFEYKIRDVVHRIEYSRIYYFSSRARKIEMVTEDSKIEFYANLGELYETLREYNFICIHKSYVVNNAHIVKFNANSVIMADGKELPISRSKRDEIKALWMH